MVRVILILYYFTMEKKTFFENLAVTEGHFGSFTIKLLVLSVNGIVIQSLKDDKIIFNEEVYDTTTIYHVFLVDSCTAMTILYSTRRLVMVG